MDIRSSQLTGDPGVLQGKIVIVLRSQRGFCGAEYKRSILRIYILTWSTPVLYVKLWKCYTSAGFCECKIVQLRTYRELRVLQMLPISLITWADWHYIQVRHERLCSCLRISPSLTKIMTNVTSPLVVSHSQAWQSRAAAPSVTKL